MNLTSNVPISTDYNNSLHTAFLTAKDSYVLGCWGLFLQRCFWVTGHEDDSNNGSQYSF
jgi:hypothetical protein